MKQLKFLFLVLIGVLVSTAFASCGSDDDEPKMPSEDEIYQQWLLDAALGTDGIQDDMAFIIQDGKARIINVCPLLSGAVTIPSEVYYKGTGKNYPVSFVEFNLNPGYGWQDMNWKDKVTSITIPSSVEDCRIYNACNIKTLSIPSSVTYLEILKCAELTTATLSEGLENVGIFECPKITTINFPQSVKEFRLSKLNIKEVTVPSNLEFMEFRECEELEAIHNLENTSLKGLGSRSLFNCKSLKEIKLPKTTSYIYYGSCEGCTSLSNVHILRTTPPRLRDSNYGAPFSVMDNLFVPKGCKEAYKEAYPWSEFKEIIEE